MLFEICKCIQFHARMCVPLCYKIVVLFSKCHVSIQPFYSILQKAVRAKSIYIFVIFSSIPLNFLLLSSAVILCSWSWQDSVLNVHASSFFFFLNKHWLAWNTRRHCYNFTTQVFTCKCQISLVTFQGHRCSSRCHFFLIWGKFSYLSHIF